MRIALEARALSLSSRGARTYAFELIRHVLRQRRDDEVSVILASRNAVGTFSYAHEIVVPLRSALFLSWWLRIQVPRSLAHLKPDIVHYTKADVPPRKTFPTVVTIYDIIPFLFPVSQSVLRRIYWPAALERAVRVSDHIFTISQASKHDIVERFSIPSDKITVTPLAVDRGHFHPITDEICRTDIKKRYRLPHSYILFLGVRDRRKNVPSLIRAYTAIAAHVPHDLIVAGQPARVPDASLSIATALGLKNRVHFVKDVSYHDLPALYSCADLFVFPSIYEGWGFPPQEAMACGVPVIVSNGGALPEVVGEAGEVVSFSTNDLEARTHDQKFEQQLAACMAAVLHDKERQRHMRERGLVRVQQFSWDDVAAKTMEIYRHVIRIAT